MESITTLALKTNYTDMVWLIISFVSSSHYMTKEKSEQALFIIRLFCLTLRKHIIKNCVLLFI